MYKTYLFDFSSVKSGGGIKRMIAFLEWFDARGGASFIVNECFRDLSVPSKSNVVFYRNISSLSRAFNSDNYIRQIISEIELCTFVYSYNSTGVRKRTSDRFTQWYHLSNVLPFTNPQEYKIPFYRSIQLKLLGFNIINRMRHYDYVSAESQFALSLLGSHSNKQLSLNGSDDELYLSLNQDPLHFENYAVVVGTYHHKDLVSSFDVFKNLSANDPDLILLVVGDVSTIPDVIKSSSKVKILGALSHDLTLRYLSKARYYICMSLVENSWNAASEGVLLSDISFISDIPPHRELVKNSVYNILPDFGRNGIIQISRSDFDSSVLAGWNDVIENMLKTIKKVY